MLTVTDDRKPIGQIGPGKGGEGRGEKGEKELGVRKDIDSPFLNE